MLCSTHTRRLDVSYIIIIIWWHHIIIKGSWHKIITSSKLWVLVRLGPRAQLSAQKVEWRVGPYMILISDRRHHHCHLHHRPHPYGPHVEDRGGFASIRRVTPIWGRHTHTELPHTESESHTSHRVTHSVTTHKVAFWRANISTPIYMTFVQRRICAV